MENRVIKFRAWDEFPKYEVSDNGAVYSLNYNHTGERRALKSRTIGRNKDPVVYLVVNKERHIRHINKMVATLFVPNPENKPCVINLDGVKSNSDYTNLAWATMSEVAKHGYSLGRKQSDLQLKTAKQNYQGEKNPKAKINSEIALSIRKLRGSGVSLKSISQMYSISTSQVSAIANNKSWINHGTEI